MTVSAEIMELNVGGRVYSTTKGAFLSLLKYRLCGSILEVYVGKLLAWFELSMEKNWHDDLCCAPVGEFGSLRSCILGCV
jgi:hypothetical protein